MNDCGIQRCAECRRGLARWLGADLEVGTFLGGNFLWINLAKFNPDIYPQRGKFWWHGVVSEEGFVSQVYWAGTSGFTLNEPQPFCSVEAVQGQCMQAAGSRQQPGAELVHK